MRILVDLQAFQAGVPAATADMWQAVREQLRRLAGQADVAVLVQDDSETLPAWLEDDGLVAIYRFTPVQAPLARPLPRRVWQLASAARRAACVAEMAPDLLMEWRRPEAAVDAVFHDADPLASWQRWQIDWPDGLPESLSAIEALPLAGHIAGHPDGVSALAAPARPRLAYVSPLPPVPSGIADYSVELLPALARFYDVTLVLGQAEVAAPELDGMPRLSVADFRREAASFDRILYHLGNSPYHAHVVELLREFPGVVVLHDVFVGHLLAHLQTVGRDPVALSRALWQTHGGEALRVWREQGVGAVLERYAACGELLAAADGVIVHSHHARHCIEQALGNALPAPLAVVPLPQAAPETLPDRSEARRRLGIEDDAFLVCSFGYAGPGKLARELVQAWREAGLAQRGDACLRLVGGHQFGGESADRLEAALADSGNAELTGYVDPSRYRDYLAAADLAVQLRTASRGETSRAVLEVLAQGIPLMANAHGSNAEVPPGWLTLLPDPLGPGVLAEALLAASRRPADLAERARAGRRGVREQHDPARVAGRYREALEGMVAGTGALARQRAWLALAWREVAAPDWMTAHWYAKQLNLLWPAPGRLRPPLASFAQPARQAPARPGAAPGGGIGRVLVLRAEHDGAVVHGEERRWRAVRDVYRQARVEVTEWWVARSATPAWPEGWSLQGWDVVHSDGAVPWEGLPALSDPHGRRPLRVLQLPRRARPERMTWPAPAGLNSPVARQRQVEGADLVLAASAIQADAWRQTVGSRPEWLVVADDTGLPLLDPQSIEDVRGKHLPRGRFAALVGDNDAASIEAFEHYVLGDSLAYLPPDVRLVIVGRLGLALLERPRFRRWAGINLARGLVLGEVDELAMAAVRLHAAVWVLPRLADNADPEGALSTGDAVADGMTLLTTSAALMGWESAAAADRTWVEDDPQRFRERLAALLRRPELPPRRSALTPLASDTARRLLPTLERLARGGLRPGEHT